MMPSRTQLFLFANWIASEVCQENFSENADFFAEVACRKLEKMGIIVHVDNCYLYFGESKP